MHILLVEDDDRVAAALRPALHRHGMSTSPGSTVDGRRSSTSTASMSCCSTSGCPTSTVWTSAGRSGRSAKFRSLLCQPAARWTIASSACTREPTTIWSSPTTSESWSPGCTRCIAADGRSRGPTGTERGEAIVLDEVTIDLQRHAVSVGDRSVTLTRKEFQVLALLASSDGAVCTRNRIVAEVWVAAGPVPIALSTCTSLRCAPSWDVPIWCRRYVGSVTDRAPPGQRDGIAVRDAAAGDPAGAEGCRRYRAGCAAGHLRRPGQPGDSCSPAGSPTRSPSPRSPAARSPTGIRAG